MKIGLLNVVSTFMISYLFLLIICSFFYYVFWLEALFAIFLSLILYKNNRHFVFDIVLIIIIFLILKNCPSGIQQAAAGGILGTFLVVAMKESFLSAQLLLSIRETILMGSVSILSITVSILLNLSKFKSFYYSSSTTPVDLLLMCVGIIVLCYLFYAVLLLLKKNYVNIFGKANAGVLLNFSSYSVILSTLLITCLSV